MDIVVAYQPHAWCCALHNWNFDILNQTRVTHSSGLWNLTFIRFIHLAIIQRQMDANLGILRGEQISKKEVNAWYALKAFVHEFEAIFEFLLLWFTRFNIWQYNVLLQGFYLLVFFSVLLAEMCSVLVVCLRMTWSVPWRPVEALFRRPSMTCHHLCWALARTSEKSKSAVKGTCCFSVFTVWMCCEKFHSTHMCKYRCT